MSELVKLTYIEDKEERNIVYKRIYKEMLSTGKFSWKRRIISLLISSVCVIVSYLLDKSIQALTIVLFVFWVFDLYRLIALPFKVKKIYQQPVNEGLRHFELLENEFRFETNNIIIKYDFSQIERIDKIDQFVLITLKNDKQKKLSFSFIIINSNAFHNVSCDDFLKIFKEKLINQTQENAPISTQHEPVLVAK